MLFRRVKEHVKDENWFAVFIDFSIVVLGVFIGFQITNWNANRTEVHKYRLAIDRYKVEAQTNIASLNQSEEDFTHYFQIVPEAIEILRRCDDTPESFIKVQEGLNRLGGTWGITLQTQALNDLNSSSDLLAQQSPETRQIMSDTAFKVRLLLSESKFVENLPLETRVEANPIVKLGDVAKKDISYNGIDFTRNRRKLLLSVPVSEACNNDELLKSFYTWEKWQGVVPLLIKRLRSEMEISVENLTE